ncbi:MAG: intradiol ring-cleavage dioxygenase [Saprospiraceae bacterium]|nr:intradiol ring-cleavage dioxygenase [Saprospiraceae bacterium]
MKYSFCLMLFGILGFVCQAQFDSEPRLVGAPCEGCEAVLEFGRKELSAIDTLSLFYTTSKKLRISGTVYQTDGQTPAPGTVLYIYQTDDNGIYPSNGTEKNWARRHGHIRAWLKTDQNGQYTFYTGQPASYPGREVPAHIHPTLLERTGRYYYVQDYYFADDPYLTEAEREKPTPRGGNNGVLHLRQEGELWVGTRDFILGKNIPNY